MPALATALVEYSDETNSRTYTAPGHSVGKPRLLIQKRKVGTIGSSSSVDDITIVYGTEDASGALLPNRVSFAVTHKRPVEGIAADTTAALALFRDVVNSDEFTAMVTTQNYIK